MEVTIGNIHIGESYPLLVIAGPCVIENRDITLSTAERLLEICNSIGLPLVFKSSFDKSNRTSLGSYRGPGIDEGLKLLSEVRETLGVPVISDIHSVEQVGPASQALDALQIPAFLCRQTDLILAASQTGMPVNIKKGPFLAPWDVRNIADKFISTGNRRLLITERGSSFGYNNLVVDYRGLPLMRSLGFPVVFDVTHSLQLPGGRGECSGGQREYAAPLARAAAAVGVDGLFMEVHPAPDKALCDGPNMVPLDEVRKLLEEARDIHALLWTRRPERRGN